MPRLVSQLLGRGMKYEKMASDALNYKLVTYGDSRLLFRGPAVNMDQPYFAFLGGIETFGKFLQSPFPNLVSAAKDRQCLNLGCAHAGPDVYLKNRDLTALCNKAEQVFIQIPSAHVVKNRFFKVHPRRNDRLITATVLLRSLYHDVDFTEFNFTRHMLRRLHSVSPSRFDIILNELQSNWLGQMADLLKSIKRPKTVIWFARHSPDHVVELDFSHDPLFVNRAMVDDVSWFATHFLEIPYRPATKGFKDRGLIYAPHETPMTDHVMGQAAHMSAADMILDVLDERS